MNSGSGTPPEEREEVEEEEEGDGGQISFAQRTTHVTKKQEEQVGED